MKTIVFLLAIIVLMLSGLTAYADANALSQYFPKSTAVFGTRIIGTAQTSDAAMIHAANVMAQYLDNNEDGIADNQAVINRLKNKGATLLMAANFDEIEHLLDVLPEGDAYQD